jgi:lactoylglutathione lyase
MIIKESGIIVFMEHYEAAVEFYAEKLGLPIRQRTEHLTFFEFGNSYLLVEQQGVASDNEKTRAQNPTVLRLDVEHFDAAVEELAARGVEVRVRRHDWGIIGIIIDPEGNRIELKAAE